LKHWAKRGPSRTALCARVALADDYHSFTEFREEPEEQDNGERKCPRHQSLDSLWRVLMVATEIEARRPRIARRRC